MLASNLPQKALVLAAILLLSILLYTSACWAFADILETQIRHQLGKAQTVGKSLTASEWRLTRKMLDMGLELHPNYSGNWILAAFFHQIAGNRPKEMLQELDWKDDQLQAVHYSRLTALNRPSSSYVWDELISNKLRLKQFDTELSGAMKRATELGLWENNVQYHLAILGLDFWEQLKLDDQMTVLSAMEQILSIQNDSPRLQERMQQSSYFPVACAATSEFRTQLHLQKLQELCGL